MKKTSTIFIIALIFLSCSKVKNHSLNMIYPEESLKNILDSFIIETKNKYPVNEIYIDHLSPQKYNLIIFSGDESLTKKENLYYGQIPIEQVVISDVTFDIYSGLEHYFDRTPRTSINNNKEPFHAYTTDGIYWVIQKDSNKININKNWDVYPFLPYPTKSSIQFSEPIVRED